jgi:hypothetical protein
MPTVASFWCHRPVEHPNAADYPALLRILQTSCDRLGLKHVVLTDHATMASGRWPQGIEGWPTDLPSPLMKAATEAQARYLESRPAGDTLFVGADCIILQNPVDHYPEGPGLCLTYRGLDAKYPINTGSQFIRRHSLGRVARIYRRVADTCQKYWCADQAALQQALAPLPSEYGVHERRGVQVAFLPMFPFNVFPAPEDRAKSAVILHFKGKRRKGCMVDWAQRHGFA